MKMCTKYRTALVFLGVVLGIGSAVSPLAAQSFDESVMTEISAGEESIADQSVGDIEDRQAMLDLLSVLEEETEIATKSKMNSDYVPGMVTVLHGDQLEALGIRTVAEALALVPGIQVARIDSGEPTVKVRGFTFPFNAGNIKVMLNSIALSRESSGINSSVLLMPVNQVDRVEIIRGPGSSVYGDFAMVGVVNILTKNSGGKVYAQGGNDDSLTEGAYYSFQDEEHSLNVGLNVSRSDDGQSATIVGGNPDEERSTGVFHLDYKDFSFKLEGVKRSIAYFGLTPRAPGAPPVLGSPPPANVGRISTDEKSWAAEGRQKIDLGPANLELYLSYLKSDGELRLPNREFEGDRIETGMDLDWSPLSGHQLLINFSYVDSGIDHAHVNDNSIIMESVALALNDLDRRNYSFSIQDQMSFFDRLSVTLGIRYDDYDDVGSLLTPKIAGVYRLGEHHVIKAQYSEGFRAPTFWELYQTGEVNEDLDFEVIETTELIYIYRRPGSVGRLTLYHSEIEDGIYSDPNLFRNFINIESKGVEVEWDQNITENFRLLANLSYVETEDDRWTRQGSTNSPGVAEWLGNLAFFLEPLPKLMVTGRWLHVGDRFDLATNSDLAGYDTVDFTVSRQDLFMTGLYLRAGIKNIFDDTVIYTTQRPHGLSKDEFQGRTFWVQLAYEF